MSCVILKHVFSLVLQQRKCLFEFPYDLTISNTFTFQHFQRNEQSAIFFISSNIKFEQSDRAASGNLEKHQVTNWFPNHWEECPVMNLQPVEGAPHLQHHRTLETGTSSRGPCMEQQVNTTEGSKRRKCIWSSGSHMLFLAQVRHRLQSINQLHTPDLNFLWVLSTRRPVAQK